MKKQLVNEMNRRPVLLPYYRKGVIEAGCDEAGRGCLAGPVFAAAVILPADFQNDFLNDSKKLTANQRFRHREIIERESLAWAVVCSPWLSAWWVATQKAYLTASC